MTETPEQISYTNRYEQIFVKPVADSEKMRFLAT